MLFVRVAGERGHGAKRVVGPHTCGLGHSAAFVGERGGRHAQGQDGHQGIQKLQGAKSEFFKGESARN